MSALRLLWPLLFASLALWSHSIPAAEVVTIEVAPGIVASANFQQGEAEKPAILLMHGWLQTHEFSTIAQLFDSLSGSGYTVLSPTLSLGINRRAKSLPCEAIHTNSIHDDISEIEQWATWLSKREQKSLVLIGHSMGATEVLAFMSQYQGDQIKQTMMVSIAPIGPGWPENMANNRDKERAQKSLAANETDIAEYGLTYCKKYVTTANNLLSFYHWDYEQIRLALSKLPIPSQIIVGSDDSLLNIDLIQKLASQKIHVDVIDGAGHFFDKEFEFELHDAIESHLTEQP